MSGTTLTAPADPIWTPQLVIALYGLTIVAGVLVFVLMKADLTAIQAGIASSAVTTPLAAVMGFYFGSAKSGAGKDQTIATLAGAPPPVVLPTPATPPVAGVTGATRATGPAAP